MNILDAEKFRHDIKGYILDGLEEAAKSIHSSRVNSEIEMVKDTLDRIASPLGKMRRFLKSYESELSDISTDVKRLSKAKDKFGGVQITKTDLTSLKFAVDNSKTYYCNTIKRV